MKKLLIFCMAALLQTHDAGALLLCDGLTSPSSCVNYTFIEKVDYNRVYDCSGGSTVSEFEVYGGCSATVGDGYNDLPKIQSKPADLVYSSNANEEQRQKYCYCQLKSINGIPVAQSALWVYNRPAGCVYVWGITQGAADCAYIAQYYSNFSSALFTAAGY
jgi:hypothetical protein